MIRAAGIMLLTNAGEALLLKRGPGGDYPGFWCFPGGTTEAGETAEETATRETIEEIGFLPKGDRTLWTRRIAGRGPEVTVDGTLPTDDLVDFTTFLQRVEERFEPILNGEHTAYIWINPKDIMDLHTKDV